MAMSKILGNAAFNDEKALAGWFHGNTKVVTTVSNIPDPNRTKLYSRNTILGQNLLNIGNFQLKSLNTQNKSSPRAWERHTEKASAQSASYHGTINKLLYDKLAIAWKQATSQ